MSSNLSVVLGASGGVGRALVDELAAAGRPVRAVCRHPERERWPIGVTPVAADLLSGSDAVGAVAGADTVFHAAQPELARWLTDFPVMNRHILAAASRAEAKLVVVDNLYAYGPSPAALTESSPARPAGLKGELRLRLARELLEAHRSGALRVTIGRASDIFGPGVGGSALGETVFGAALQGRTVRYLGPLDLPHTMAFTPDVARGLIVLGDRPGADGQIWHLPAAPAATGQELGALIEAALGRPVKLTPTGWAGFQMASLFVPILRELRETRYQWTAPFISDHSAFDRAFGALAVTPLADAVARTVAGWRTASSGQRGAVAAAAG